MTFTPRSIVVNESIPTSVAAYRLTAKDASSGAMLAGPKDYASNGQTELTLPIGTDGFLTQQMVGILVSFFVQEIGPDGTVTDPVIGSDATGHGSFVINALPDGAEKVTVVV